MDPVHELWFALRTLLAAVLGGAIGLERERDGHEAGARTHAILAAGACLFGIVSFQHGSVLGGDPTRIAAQVACGVGFLGAGVILHDRKRVKGLTTAATLWTTTAIGLAVAYDMVVLGILTTLIVYTALSLHKVPAWRRLTRPRENASTAPGEERLNT